MDGSNETSILKYLVFNFGGEIEDEDITHRSMAWKAYERSSIDRVDGQNKP